MSRDKEWFELPRPAAVARLVEIRNELRAKNLHDTEDPPHPQGPATVPAEAKIGRTANGEFNDLPLPDDGQQRRAVRPQRAVVRDVSRRRQPDEPEPADDQPGAVHPRQVSAGHDPQRDGGGLDPVPDPRLVPAPAGHDGQRPRDSAEGRRPVAGAARCALPKTPVDPQKRPDPKRPPAYVNDNSHWWDGSQIYGSTPAVQATLRTGEKGKVKVGDDCRLGLDPVTGLEVTGMTENAWVALSLLHGLFALEHNAVCDRLAQEFPTLGRSAALHEGPPDRQRADGEDPHRGVDAGDPAASAHGPGAAHQLVRAGARTPEGVSRPAGQRVPERHPRFADRPPHRAVFADRRVRGRLPHARAAAGRFHPVVG